MALVFQSLVVIGIAMGGVARLPEIVVPLLIGMVLLVATAPKLPSAARAERDGAEPAKPPYTERVLTVAKNVLAPLAMIAGLIGLMGGLVGRLRGLGTWIRPELIPSGTIITIVVGVVVALFALRWLIRRELTRKNPRA